MFNKKEETGGFLSHILAGAIGGLIVSCIIIVITHYKIKRLDERLKAIENAQTKISKMLSEQKDGSVAAINTTPGATIGIVIDPKTGSTSLSVGKPKGKITSQKGTPETVIEANKPKKGK